MQIIEGPLPDWKPGRISNSINQDDLYVDMTFAQVLDDKGLDATTEDFGAMFGKRSMLCGTQTWRPGVP